MLTHNGYEYVDLGLPSGLKWATCNVGASSPEEYGLYFAWGETTGYTAAQVKAGERVFSSMVYKAGSAASISTDLTLEQDAARTNLGGNWRMPTRAEIKELINNCDTIWTDDYNGTGVAGQLLTSKVNGNSMFFPLPVVAMVPWFTAWARAATNGPLRGTRIATPGSCTSNPRISAMPSPPGTMGYLFVGYSNNKINYICNKLDIYTYPAFILSNVLKSTNFLLYLY